MEGVVADTERGHPWNMVIDENKEGRDNEKYFLHTKILDIYIWGI